MSLISFHHLDPSWSQITWNSPINNLAGSIGAWLADILFSIFGILAYFIPLIMLIWIWNIFKDINNQNYLIFFILSLRLIGGLSLIITSCAITTLNIDDLPNFPSGGIIGSIVINLIVPWFNILGTILVLFCIWIISFTLFTGCSWLAISEKIGALVLAIIMFIMNRNSNKVKKIETYVSSYLDKLYNSRLEIGYYINPNDIIFSTLSIKNLGSSNNKNNISYRYKIESLISTETKIHSDIQQAEIDKYDGNIFGKLSNIDILMNDKVNIKPPINNNDPIQTRKHLKNTINSSNNLIALATKTDVKDDINTTNIPGMPIKAQINQYIDPEITLPKPIISTQRKPYSNSLMAQKEHESNIEYKVFSNSAVHFKGNNFSVIYWNENKLYNQLFLEQKYCYNINNINRSKSNFNSKYNSTPLYKTKLNILVNSESQINYRLPLIDNINISLQQVEKDIIKTSLVHKPLKLLNTSTECGYLYHHFFKIDNQRLSKDMTTMPSLDLLASPINKNEPVDMFLLQQTARLIEARLSDYRVKVEVVSFSLGPVITRFELNLAPGVKASRISNLSKDLSRALSTTSIRIVEVIAGKPYVGLELPNKKRQTIYLREVLDYDEFRHNLSPLTIVLGKDIEGQPVIANLGDMPHLLIAGTTGSGKSVGVNAMILSILYKAKPEDVRFIMIDPKMLELSIYEGIPHLLTKVVTNSKDAANALCWCINEMERRYKIMSVLGVRNLDGYNNKINAAELICSPIFDPLGTVCNSVNSSNPVLRKEPYIVVIVDEFADLMMTSGKKIEELIARLAQKARAAGIHLVLATQRPSVDVITGLIKANIPSRIAFTVSSKIDSRTILDQCGAESLLGMGDMLYLPHNSSIPIRVHGAFVMDKEVHDVAKYWQARGKPKYIDKIINNNKNSEDSNGCNSCDNQDPLFNQVVNFIIKKQRVSISSVQRQFRVGYNRAARIVDQMEAQGIVSKPGHTGNREVLTTLPNN